MVSIVCALIEYILCFVHLSSSMPVPLSRVQGEKSVQILVQLKLNEMVKNSFEYCEVRLPFFNRYSSHCHLFL